MRPRAAFALFSFVPCMMAQTAPISTPAEVTVDVTYSQVVYIGSGTNGVSPYQQLDAVILGHEVRLISEGSNVAVLAPGKYIASPARPSFESKRPHPTYDLYQAYTLRLPDGKTRKFDQVGMGVGVPNP